MHLIYQYLTGWMPNFYFNTFLISSAAISYWIPMSNWLVKPMQETLTSLSQYLSFPFSSVSKMKSTVQSRMDSTSPKFSVK